MKVFVLNKHGKPLMPTTPRKARLLLKEEKAKIVSHSPFTIRLLYGSSGYKQKVKLGIDAGYKTIGFSAVSQKDELVSGEVKLLENQSERIRDRAVHHIGYWKKDRTDRPENLITLCSKCHSPANHNQKGSLYGWEPTVAPFRGETFMSQVRWRLVNKLEHCRHTYGYQTKSKRIDLELEKTHYNDAFVIAGGQRQNRTEVLIFQEKRKNNRCLEKFYDAKFIDIGSGKKVGGADLPCGRVKRNKSHEKNGENLKKYRGKKVSKGRRQIRKQRYPIQPHDVVKYNGNFYRAVGIQNKGKYLKMSDGTDKIVKNIKDIEIVFHQKTLVLIDAISM